MSVIGMIWAQDRAGMIGDGKGMLWKVPADFAHFRTETYGHPVIMGRASWEALGSALPGRRNIVLTQQDNYVATGAEVCSSLPAALEITQDSELVWIAGGGQIYAQALPLADFLVVSYLDLDSSGSVSAPPIDPRLWKVDPVRSDTRWRPQSGDARWKVTTYLRRS